MTDTTELTMATASDASETPKRSGSLSTLRLAELQGLANSLGLTGTTKMRKSDLLTAIKARQSGGSAPTAPATASSTAHDVAAEPVAEPVADAPPSGDGERVSRRSRRAGRPAGSANDAPSVQNPNGSDGAITSAPPETEASAPAGPPSEYRQTGGHDGSGADHVESGADRTGSAVERAGSGADRAGSDGDRGRSAVERAESGAESAESGAERSEGDRRPENLQNDRQRDNRQGERQDNRGGQDNRQDNRGEGQRDNRQRDNRQDNRGGQDNRQENRGEGQRDNRGPDNRGGQDNRQDNRGGQDNRGPDNRQDNRGLRDGDDDAPGGRRRSRQRSRDRKRRGGTERESFGGQQNEQMESVTEDDVLIPVAGILDVLDNYAFVRTSGYLPGPNDVYVPLGIVKKNGLRKGDAVTGAVKALREGELLAARQKFNALVRLDTVNGMSPEESRNRVEFGKLTPLYPQERLRLETESNILATRLIDLVAPIGKGQRGLIVSPPKAGKTLILQAIANAIAVNNPEAHLMIVLVDERPEEVTDMQRTVKGEVIASTFDRPAEDHTTVAELAIERAKRLVEMGHDVVVLLDSITRLGRAYNLAAPASGRILSGGVDSSALYPPKRFFGAARNIEHGGSLTILATALVETGSKMDEVIFEEFKGTGNMELRLSRSLADRRIFPAIDVNPSGTRREEILMASDELKIVWKLRRVLSALDQQQGIELLIDRLKKTRSNVEFLMQVQKTSSIQMDDD